QIFKDATLFFSCDGILNLAIVIPAMDHIDEVLATSATACQFSISIQAALSVGKKTLNRYYSKTDLSEVYHIAMVLHPRHKLEYFKTIGWSEEWCMMAHQIVHDTFDHNYKTLPIPNGGLTPVVDRVRTWYIYCYVRAAREPDLGSVE
ncbi:hypothetical protein EI94DRAFT_1595283, partial [Lactarius quietus]